MLGPFGKANPLEKANQLVVQDTVANLKRIRSIIKDSEASETDFDTYSHTCKYILARDAEKTLHDLLGDPKDLVRATQPAPSLFGNGRGGMGEGFRAASGCSAECPCRPAGPAGSQCPEKCACFTSALTPVRIV